MIEQMRAEEQQQRLPGRQLPSSSSAAGGQDEGYWAYMQRQVQERTEKLGVMGDSMDKLEENSSSWANDVSKYVSQQKKKVLLGGTYHVLFAVRVGFSLILLCFKLLRASLDFRSPPRGRAL